ncbi:MAG: hypothetical protein ABI273_20225 [Lacunisphaera sp.]
MKLVLTILLAALALPALADKQDKERFLEAKHIKQTACADAIEHALSKATTIELFAIDPSFPRSEEEAAKDPRPKFLDWRVVAQTVLTSRKWGQAARCYWLRGLNAFGWRSFARWCGSARHSSDGCMLAF